MIAKLIQRQVPLDSEVKIILKGGQEISGVLTEIGRTHITLEQHHKLSTILLEMVGAWEILNGASSQPDIEIALEQPFASIKIAPQSIIEDSSVLSETPFIDDQLIPEESLLLKNSISLDQLTLSDESIETQESKKSLDQKTLDNLGKSNEIAILEANTAITQEVISGETNTELATDTDKLELEVLEKLEEIETRIQIQVETSTLDTIKPPDFILENNVFQGRRKNEAIPIWNRVKDRYNYAVKVKEIDNKFGRLLGILSEVETLADWFPTSPGVKRHLAYLHWLSGNDLESIECYKASAKSHQNNDDWYNLAVLAIKNEKNELACYSLTQFFKHSTEIKEINAWYIFVRLLKLLSNYSEISTWLETTSQDFSTSEELLLLETSIYLLKTSSYSENAYSVAEEWLKGESAKSLTIKAFKQLVSQPNESYQQIVATLSLPRETTQRRRGNIYAYYHNVDYGFLRDDLGVEYFFDRNQILEYGLFDKVTNLKSYELIPVFFEATESAKGPRAIQLSLTIEKTTDRESTLKLQGSIYVYKSDRNYGFLRTLNGQEYFFHKSAVVEAELFTEIQDLAWGAEIPVIFETAKGARGSNLVAVNVSRFRDIDAMFKIAKQFANEGEYHKAIAQIKQVLNYDSLHRGAQEAYEKWRKYARLAGVSKASTPYARAKRADIIEQDLERAVELYLEAINQGDNVESAIKDRAALLIRLERAAEAIEFLLKNRKKISDQKTVDNLLISFYPKAGQHEQAVKLLEKQLEKAQFNNKRIEIWQQIAQIFLNAENYQQAEQNFRNILRLQSSNQLIERKIAICLFKQEKFDESEKILNKLLPDAQAAELLEAIKEAKVTGFSSQVDQIIIETTLSDFSREISPFTKFFLDRCKFEGVRPDQARSQKFRPTDVKELVDLATQLGIRRPGDRAGYYLSAAKIVSILEGGNLTEQFYTYLGRSFASRADSSISENKPLDVARELYCEALAIYDGNSEGVKGEQDAVNTLSRFLFSILGQTQIPHKPHLSPISADDIEKIISLHIQPSKVFDAIAYLIYRSRYAANHILKLLYHKETSLRSLALEYIAHKGVITSEPVKNLDDFVRLWNRLQLKNLDEARNISKELRFLQRSELTTASLENGIERIKGLSYYLFFDLDHKRIGQLQQILETSLDLCKQVRFEEQERLCIQIDDYCQDLISEIENNPTKFSIEELHNVIQIIQDKAKSWQEDLYERAVPQLSLRLAVESYTPNTNEQIEVQVAVENWIGRSPAESLELVVQEDEATFVLTKPEHKLDGSLRGGDRKILKIPIRLTKQAIDSQTFSLPIYAQYRTRSEGIVTTPVNSFSIRLYGEGDFTEIDNPYAAYTESHIVKSPDMFYGRQELIDNAARAIKESRNQGKSIVIYGQKRAGKSSVLYHLKSKLETDPCMLILDLGNIGSILDENSKLPLIHQILWSILSKLAYTIEDKLDCGYSGLELTLPTFHEFYNNPAPLILFKDTFVRFKRATAKSSGWKDTQVVLLIDEFSYIYEWIVSNRISDTFMKNWKALLQENYFSVVLVGQDVMPKFKQLFPNEFGTTQDERVSYLKKEDAIKLIDEPIRMEGRQGSSRYREQAIEKLVDLTAGSPFYIQIICNRLVEYMNRKRAPLVTAADIEQVKIELISGVNALTLDKFDNLISSGDTSEEAISDKDALSVLTAIALNSQTGPCSRNSIICETRTLIDTILDDLVKREVVERERGSYYRIRVELFKEWLIANR